MLRKLLIGTAAAAVALPLAMCGRHDTDDRPVLVVSIEPQRLWLEELAGDYFRIVSLMPNGANPETYEPSVQGRRDVESAAAYFMVGPLVFEQNLMLGSKNREAFVNTSASIPLIYGTHTHDSAHIDFLPGDSVREADPHVWTSMRNARTMATVMANRLVALDPDHASQYSERLGLLTARMDSADRAYAVRLADAPSRTFMVWHPSLSYFARDYGLEQLAVGHESKEVSAQTLKHVIDEALGDSVRVFFFQRDYDSRQAESINNGVGSRLVEINPGSYDWFGEMDIIVNELSRP